MKLFDRITKRENKAVLSGDGIDMKATAKAQNVSYEIYLMCLYAQKYQPVFDAPQIEFDPEVHIKYFDVLTCLPNQSNITVLIDKATGQAIYAYLEEVK